MPIVDCPIEDCTYSTPDLDAIIVAALLTTHATTHAAPTTGTRGAAARVEKVKRPTISSAGSSEDWKYFLSRWADYVAATRVTGADGILQLLECCDEQLRKDLTRSSAGTLLDKTEDDVLIAIRSLAVREENVMVARVTLNNMHQDRDETIRSFGARLRGQAGVCKYAIECPECEHDVDYTEPILRDVLSRGIEDSDIQLELLGHINQDMTLEEVFRFVEAKEAGKRSASRLLDSQAAEAISSSYNRHKRDVIVEQYAARGDNNHNAARGDNNHKLCSYCGRKGHGDKSITKYRQKQCPAFGHTCIHCNRPHHFDSMCRSKGNPKVDRPPKINNHQSEGAIFNTLCAIPNKTGKTASRDLAMDHHLYDHLSDSWLKQPSKPQPSLNVTVKILDDDYRDLGFQPIGNLNPRTVTLSAMADTGCQSCLAGFKCIRRLGLTQHYLIPVTMKMHAANNRAITILGAVILRILGKNRQGYISETRQLTYVTHDSDKLFLSKGACIDLGMITDNFPTIGEVVANKFSEAAMDTTQSDCGCPKRTPPPPVPSELPIAATTDNREKLQQYLLQYYSASTFNTCEHQPLPLMEGPPLKLMIDADAEPVAFHTPIPVPIHWQDEVKAGLDRDVQLGVLEPVPVGEPVTWCHRMVVCAKKDGTPRRTVDFQPLNAYATRETHHTQSPFHQVRAVPPGKKKDCV